MQPEQIAVCAIFAAMALASVVRLVLLIVATTKKGGGQMSDWIEKAADRIARWLRPLMPVEATKAKVREVVHDAYMDRDGELRDLLCCPPDCDLTSWAKRLGDFWHDLEGGQVVDRYKACLKAFGVDDLREITPEDAAAMYEQWQADWDQAAKDSAEVESLKQQLADLERQYDRFEQIIQDADSQAYKLRELLDGKSPGRTVFAEMLVCLPEMVTQVQEMKEQLATSNARCAAMQKWVMFATREDAGQVMAAIDAEIEQIAKDHRAMEAAESMKGQMMTVQYDDRFGWSVACGFIMCRYGSWQPTLTDAILAAEAAQKEGE